MADFAERPLNAPAPLAPRIPDAVYPIAPGEPAPPGGGGQRISFGAVLRFHWTFLTILLSLGVPATVVSFLITEPEDEAGATVQVWPTRDRVLYRADEDARSRFFQQYINSQMGLITSRTILERTLANPAVQKTRWYLEPEPPLLGGPQTDLERLQERIKVTIIPGTFLLRITARAGSADEAVLLANTVHDEYLRYVGEQVDEGSELILDRLTPEERQLAASIQERERRQADQLRDIRVTSPEELVSIRGKRIEEMRGDLQALQREVAVLERQVNISGGASASQPTEQSEQSRFAADRTWNDINLRLEEARLRMADATERLGPRNPAIESIRRQVESYERQLAGRQQFLNEQAAALLLRPRSRDADEPDLFDPERLGRLRDQKRFEAEQLERAIAAEEESYARDFKRALDLKFETDALERDRSKYRLIQQRIDELRMEGSIGSIRSAAKAAPPSRPSNWKKPYMMAGLAFGAAAGLGFVAANWRAMRTPAAADFARAEQAPVLGTIPDISRKRLPRPIDVMLQEHVRIVRTGLLNRLSAAQRGVILITSAGPQAGKTTVSLMLARSLSQAGKRVLLVDADLYRPSLARRLGIRPPAGLEDVLEGRLGDAEAMLSGDTPNLDLLPIVSETRVSANELLASGLFERGLQRWRERYEFVILDGCPLLPVADARILLRLVDGTVLVAREGHCRHSDLAEALHTIDAAGGNLLGSVFVGARPTGSSYRDYY